MIKGSNPIIWSLSISLLTFIVYLPALQNGFVNWDDTIYVYENQGLLLTGLDFIRWSFFNASVGHWHPVTWFSLGLDYAVWGLDPFGYHLTNILFHAINTFLVFILVSLLVECGLTQNSKLKTQNFQWIAAFVTALLFGIHPLHVESVAWVVERKDVLSLLFFLMTLLSYIKYTFTVGSKKRVYYGITLLLFAIALMTKPMVITLPIVLLVLDFYPFQRLTWKESKWVIIEKIPFFLLTLISSFITVWAAGSVEAMGERFGFITRLFISARGYIFYLLKMAFPSDLGPLYQYPVKVDIFTVDYLGAAFLLLFITIYCLWSLKRGRLILAVWLYYLITLLPVIGIVHAGPQDTADRYTYMPSIGPFLLIGLAVGNIFERFSKRSIPIALLLLLLSGILIDRTVKQIGVWHDPVTLWTHEVRLFPDVPIAYGNLGQAYIALENYQLALGALNRAIELDIGYYEAYNNRGAIYFNSGKYRQAIKDFSMALEIKKDFKQVYPNRGRAFNAVKEYDKAIKDFDRTIEMDPRSKVAYVNRGKAYYGLGDYEKAVRDYSKALEIDPLYANAYNNRASLYYEMGKYSQSISDLNRAVELNLEKKNAYFNMGLVYARLGKREEALSYIRKAADLGLTEAREYLNKDEK